MARQKTKLSDRFGSGGNKETSKEASLFGDPELEETPEFKAMHLLMDQIDDITDVVNANDAASGSYAALKNNYTTASGSFSTRVTDNKTTHLGSSNSIFIHPTQFRGGTYSARTQRAGLFTQNADDVGEQVSCACMIPIGKSLIRVTLYSSNTKTEATVNNLLLSKGTTTALVFNNKTKQATTINASQPWDLYTTVVGGAYLQSGSNNLIIVVTLNSGDFFRGAVLTYA